MSQNYPYQCVTTNPYFLEAVVSLLKDCGNNITIGDSSAFYQSGHTLRGFKTSGFTDLIAKYNIRLCAFEVDGVKLVSNSNNKILKEILLPKILDDTEYIVNLPKLKTHSFFILSGAIKNLFGFVPGSAKFEYHFLNGIGRDVFGEKLVDIYQTIKPDLHIMDAIIGLENGPTSMGKPKETGLILISENPFALDYTISKIIGFNPEEITSTNAGIDRGLLKTEEIDIKGDFNNLPSVVYKKPDIGDDTVKDKNLLYKISVVRPHLIKKRCFSCGICKEVCPLNAIKINDYPVFDYNKCLYCLHCFYKCPLNAIKLKGAIFNPLIQKLRKIIKL